MDNQKIEAPQLLKRFAKFASKSSIKSELQLFYCKGDTLYVTDSFKAARIKIADFDCHGLIAASEVGTITKSRADVTVLHDRDLSTHGEGLSRRSTGSSRRR